MPKYRQPRRKRPEGRKGESMIQNWSQVDIVPEFSDQGVDCYRLVGGDFCNEYYIVSEAETRKLMNHPEVVG